VLNFGDACKAELDSGNPNSSGIYTRISFVGCSRDHIGVAVRFGDMLTHPGRIRNFVDGFFTTSQTPRKRMCRDPTIMPFIVLDLCPALEDRRFVVEQSHNAN
jgi:hypothetical protein